MLRDAHGRVIGKIFVYGCETWRKLGKRNPSTKQIVGNCPSFKFTLFNKANK